MYMCALRNQRLSISLLPQSLSTLFWGAGLLMNTELTNWMNYLSSQSLLFLPTNTRITETGPCLTFIWVPGFEFRSSYLDSKYFTHWAICLSSFFFFDKFCCHLPSHLLKMFIITVACLHELYGHISHGVCGRGQRTTLYRQFSPSTFIWVLADQV